MSTNPSLVVDRQLDLFTDAILRFFTQKELLAIRPVCKHARDAAERYIWTRFTSFSGASSVIPAQFTKSKTLQDKVVRRIWEIGQSGGTARIASDQITDAAFFRGLLGPSLTLSIKVNAGTRVPREGIGSLPGSAQQVGGPSEHGKAHSKFITGGGGVLVGSPNFTPNALSGGTVESVAQINNIQVQGYFNRYFELMRASTPENRQQFTNMVQAFNRSNRPVSLALAPFVQIQPWLLTQVAGADRLIIRMFLISHLKDGNDIVSGLNAMAKSNPRMTIDAYIDEGQVNETFSEYFDRRERRQVREYYVWQACQILLKDAPNVRVYTQKGTSGIMHDKLILAEKDLPPKADGEKQVAKRLILGSSGFSQHVMHNQNFDIMVRIDDNGLYDYMMQHHTATLKSAAYGTAAVRRV